MSKENISKKNKDWLKVVEFMFAHGAAWDEKDFKILKEYYMIKKTKTKYVAECL